MNRMGSVKTRIIAPIPENTPKNICQNYGILESMQVQNIVYVGQFFHPLS